METKKFGQKYIIRIDKGEEVVETLKNFCEKFNIRLGTVSGIGAANDVTIGLFDPEKKEYHSKKLTGNFEIAALVGNVSTMNGEIYLHLHITLGDEKHNSFSGHLSFAVISATAEIIIDAISGEVDRKMDENIGLNLLVLDKESK